MTGDAAATGKVVVVRELEATPDVAWRAWSDPEQIQQWWGPVGFTCPRAVVDFRVGGSTLVTMQAPPEYGGFSMHNRWTYTVSPSRAGSSSSARSPTPTAIRSTLRPPASRPACRQRYHTSSTSSRCPAGGAGSP